MFYVFCDAAVFAAAAGVILSIISNFVKRNKRKSIAKISDAFGFGFMALTVATTVCFFAGL